MPHNKHPRQESPEQRGKMAPQLSGHTRQTEMHSTRAKAGRKPETGVRFSIELLRENDLYERQDS